MKNIIDFLNKNKLTILSILFWIFLILVLFTSYYYQSANLIKIKENQTLIQINYKEIMRKDSIFNILLKNDSLIINKLENEMGQDSISNILLKNDSIIIDKLEKKK